MSWLQFRNNTSSHDIRDEYIKWEISILTYQEIKSTYIHYSGSAMLHNHPYFNMLNISQQLTVPRTELPRCVHYIICIMSSTIYMGDHVYYPPHSKQPMIM